MLEYAGVCMWREVSHWKSLFVLKVVLDVPPPGLVKLVVLCCDLSEERVHLSTKQPVQSPERSAFLGEIGVENGRGFLSSGRIVHSQVVEIGGNVTHVPLTPLTM